MCLSPKTIKNPCSNLGCFPEWKRFIEVPCGKCDECRSLKASEWGFRCVAEMMTMSAEARFNCWFITLTYDEAHNRGCLIPYDMEKFIKSLRNSRRDLRIKYFYCGEYGTQTYRPHYHLILFNYPIDDLQCWAKSKNGYAQYMSKTLSDMWGRGLVSVSELNLATASYTARYSLKKNKTDCYQRMSQGIGKKYFFKYMKEIISSNRMFVPNSSGGISYGCIPRYYLKLYRKFLNDDVAYARFLRHRMKIGKKAQEVRLSGYKDESKFDYIAMNSIGLASAKMIKYREAKRLMNQALGDFIHFRDF